MKIEKIKLSKLKAAAYNPRKDLKPEDKEYQKVKNSLGKWGLVDPIVVRYPSMIVIGGHQRLKVLLEEGGKNQEFTMLVLGDIAWVFKDKNIKIKDDSEEKALNIALNKISGEWDDVKLIDLLTEFKDFETLDIELTGFDTSEIERIEKSLELEIKDLNPRDPPEKTVYCPKCGTEVSI